MLTTCELPVALPGLVGYLGLFEMFYSITMNSRKVLTIILHFLIAVAYMTLAGHKVMAAMQRREGPNVVGIFGLLQHVADGLKLLSKETMIPSSTNIVIFFSSTCVGGAADAGERTHIARAQTRITPGKGKEKQGDRQQVRGPPRQDSENTRCPTPVRQKITAQQHRAPLRGGSSVKW